MSFHWPHAFWLLLLPVGFALAELTRRVRSGAVRHPKIMRAEAAPSGLRLLGNSGADRGPRVRWRLWLGLALAVVATTRPQYGEVEEQVFEQAREILIAVDLSRSMMAPDVSPSRLDRSKLLITSLLERLEGERVGLIVYAGTAFLQSPLSADYEILREFLPALGPDYLPAGGTDYAAMLDAALDAFGQAGEADRFLIVLSDGESQNEAWEQRVATLRERGIRVIGLGVGTTDGAMLPDGKGGLVKDERGAVVLSRLNPATLEELARRTGGAYRDASAWVDLAELLQQTVETGRQGEFADRQNVRRIERFQWALAPALLFLLWSLWREFPVQPRQRAVTLVKPRNSSANAATLLLTAGLAFTSFATRAEAVEKVPGAPAAAEPPALEAPLNTLVGRLSAQPEVSATEFAELAQTTIDYGQRVQQSGQKPEVGAVHDALAGVDAGEALDAKAADWPALRAALEKLLEDDSQQQQQQQDQQNQDQNQDQKDQQNQQQNQGGSGQNGDQQQSDSDQGQQNQPGDQGQEGDQGESGDQNQNQSNSESGQQEQQQNQGESDNDSSDSSPPQQRPQPSPESAFGDMDEPAEQPQAEQDAQPPAPRPAPEPGTQQVGGQPTRSSAAQNNPQLAVPLQKLDQLKQQDSPAQLYQLMQDPDSTPSEPGRDW